MMVRECGDDRDDECVVRGREVRTTTAHVLDVVAEELQAIVEELQNDGHA
jgi:hypothetical protein